MPTATATKEIRLLLESLNIIMEGTPNPEEVIKQLIVKTGKSDEELVAGLKQAAGKQDGITEGEVKDFFTVFLVQSTLLGYVVLGAAAGSGLALGEFGVIEPDKVSELVELLKSPKSLGPAWFTGLMGLSIIELFLTIYDNVKDLPKAITEFARKIHSNANAKGKIDSALAKVSQEKGILSANKTEHITAEKGRRELSFTRHGREFGGWLEARGDNEVDVVVVLDSQHEFEKGISITDKKSIARAVINCADVLSGAKVKPAVEEDMLLPAPEEEAGEEEVIDTDNEKENGLNESIDPDNIPAQVYPFKLRLPQIMEFNDYHDIPAYEEDLSRLGINITIAEIGSVSGRYIALAHMNTPEHKRLFKELESYYSASDYGV